MASLGAAIQGAYSSSRSKSKSTQIPPFARSFFKEFAPIGSQTLSGFEPGGDELSGIGRDYFRSVVSGDFLRPESNPYLTANIEALQRGAQQTFDALSNRLRGQAQLAGGLYGTRANVAGGQLAERVSQNTNDLITRLLFGNYGQERSLQQQAAGPATKLQFDSLNAALAIAALLRGSTQKGSVDTSGYSVSGGVEGQV